MKKLTVIFLFFILVVFTALIYVQPSTKVITEKSSSQIELSSIAITDDEFFAEKENGIKILDRIKEIKGSNAEVLRVYSDSFPRFVEVIIDPLDVHVGDIQELTVKIEDPDGVNSLTAIINHNLGNDTINLNLVEGDKYNGVWSNEWKVHSTYSAIYHTTFTAVNNKEKTNSITLAWSDPCSPPPGGDWTLDGDCSISNVNGVDNGNFIVAAGKTLTIQNTGTFVFNPGKQITFSGGTIAINKGGQIKKTNLWMTDADSDNYPSSTTQIAQDTAPLNGRRRYLMATTSSTDCDDGASSVTVCLLPPSLPYGIQIDIQSQDKIPTSTQLQTLNPGWARFVYRPGIALPNLQNAKSLVIFTGESAPPAPIGSTDFNTWKNYVDNTFVPALRTAVRDNPDIDAIQIWNEEDICPSQAYCPGMPAAAYAYMLKESAAAIKANNNIIQVVMGGLASGQPSYITDVENSDADAFNNVDAVGIHPYGKSPDGWCASSCLITLPFGDLATSIDDYRAASPAPIWVTEIGYGTDDRIWQAGYLMEAFNVLSNLYVPVINWYAWIDSMTGGNENNWGLYDINGGIKPSGNAFISFTNPSAVIDVGAGDLWADTVIGQRDFTEINPNEIVPDKVFNPGGVIVDSITSNPGKAYIWDSNNNRILGIDLTDCYAKPPGTRCSGQIVFGQPSLNDYGACNHDSSLRYSTVEASADSLCGVSASTVTLEEQRSKSNMAVDSAGNLYVPDIENNRVLKYNSPFTTDTIADEVWGQADFTGNLCNRGGSRSASTICFNFEFWGSGGHERHGGVAIDSNGNLWVADTDNHRVLRFSKQNNQIAKVADIVLGQTGFTGANYGSGLNQLYAPTAITFDSSGKLYVADSGNTRVVVFTPPFSSGMTGATFGSDFAHNQVYYPSNSTPCNTVQGGYTGAYTGCDGNPWDVQADPRRQGIWTYETVVWDSRIRLWSFTGALLKTIDNSGKRGGGSLGIDKSGNVLVATGSRSDVSRYQLQPDGSYAHVQNLFSPPSGHNLVTNKRFSLTSQGGLAIVGNQLAVADGRLLFWNNIVSLTNGKAADGYLRTSSSDNIRGPTDYPDYPSPRFNYMKSTADKLWVSGVNKIMIYLAPLSSGDTPTKTISSANVLGGGTINFASSNQQISGIAVDPTGNFLWVSQDNSHRVLRIRNPLSSTPIVDVILGQPNLDSKYCNQDPNNPANTDRYASPGTASSNTLCYPGALGIDKLGNLYVSDHFHEIAGNKRLLMFSSTTFPDNPATVVFAPAATKEFPASQRFATWEPAFDSTNRMVVGYNPYAGRPKRVDYFNNPTGSSTTPNGQLNDFDAWPIAATFDSQDNLYVYEANRGQVRIYRRPFN